MHRSRLSREHTPLLLFRRTAGRVGYVLPPPFLHVVLLTRMVGPTPSSASQRLHAYLARHNENYMRETQSGKVAPPVVRVLRWGTFGEFRDWKVHVTGMAAGQIKVPLVVWDEEIREWLAARVVQEF